MVEEGATWISIIREYHRLTEMNLHNHKNVVVHGVAKSRTRLSDFTFTFHFHAFLALRIRGTGEPGGLPSMGLHRVRHD